MVLVKYLECAREVCSNFEYLIILTTTIIPIVVEVILLPPHTPITNIVPMYYHENPVKSDKRTNCVIYLECNRTTMLDCEEKSEIPHETSLLV